MSYFALSMGDDEPIFWERKAKIAEIYVAKKALCTSIHMWA